MPTCLCNYIYFLPFLCDIYVQLLNNSNGRCDDNLTMLCRKLAKESKSKVNVEDGDFLEEEGGDGPDGSGDCCQQPLGRQLTSMNVLALENNEQEVIERDQEVILSGWISLFV